MMQESTTNLVFSWRKAFYAVMLCAAASMSAATLNAQSRALADGTYEIKGGESHSYSISLTAGQYFYALVDQQGIDLEVTLSKPDSSQIAVTDSPNGSWGPEPILLVADQSGDYRVDIRAPNPKANAAHYQVKIVAEHEATAIDKGHVTAERTFEEAQKLQSRPTAADKHAAIVKYQEAVPLFQAAEDTYSQTLTVQALSLAYAQVSEYRTALRFSEDALSLAKKVGEERLEAPIETLLGGINDVLGEIIQSQQHFERARQLAKRLGDNLNEGSALNNMGKLYNDAGDFQKALDYYRQALPLLADRPERRALALNNIGVAYSALNEPDRALDYFQQSLTLLKTGRDRTAESQTLSNIGFVYQSLAKYRDALDYYAQARAMQQKIGNRAQEAQTLELLGTAYSEMGQPDKAVDYHQQALEIQRAAKNIRREALSLNSLGHVYGLL